MAWTDKAQIIDHSDQRRRPSFSARRFSKQASTHQGDSDFGFYGRIGKRVFDISFALFLLPVLLPVIALTWAIARSDGGPGFYAQKRIGRDGRVFRCWKIRTMQIDAERKLWDYLATNSEAAGEWDRDRKLTHDPRITRYGEFFRKTSLDELPQIWNVLVGDMSFVGPRPVVRSEMAKYGLYRNAYKRMKPGVTGLWQVSGRNDVSYETRVALDVTYLQTHSLRLDVALIAKTVTAMLNRTGK